MAKNKSERVGRTEEKGGGITRRENVQSHRCRGRGGGGAEWGRGGGRWRDQYLISVLSSLWTVFQ